MPLRNILFLFACSAVSLAAWAAGDRGEHGRRFGEVLAIIDRSALEPVAADRLLDAAVEAVVAELDEHSAFLPPDAQADLEAQLDQRFGGVGLQLSKDHRRDFLWRKALWLTVDLYLNVGIPVGCLNKFVRNAVLLATDFVIFAAHEAFHRENCVRWISDRLPFGSLADKTLARFCEGDD